jgi:Sec-independent protein translocase protein TatA
MSFFGIGPMELIFILIIMVLVLGPKNMVISAKKMGITLRKIVKSPLWATVMDTSREIREIPTRLIREAGIEEDLKGIKSATDSIKDVGNISIPYDLSKSGVTKKEGVTEVEKIQSETTAIEVPTEKIASDEVDDNHIHVDGQVNQIKEEDEDKTK